MDSVEKRVTIRAPQSRVWRAITDPAEFGDWFGMRVAGAFQPGSKVNMTCTMPKYEGVSFYVVVDRMEPESLFSWRWHPGLPQEDLDYSKEPMTTVEFRLQQVDGGTMVTVTESGFDRISLPRRAQVLKENESGWVQQLQSLERYVGSKT